MLEAMAASIPIIASRVSALPEIVVDGQIGYLVPPADPAAIAQRLRDIFSDLALAQQLGENGRRRLEQEFSVTKMVQNTMQVYGLGKN
jgi:glycosyltransferase involved in cell wall biosynthesis